MGNDLTKFYLISFSVYVSSYFLALIVIECVVNKRIVSPVIDLTIKMRKPKEMERVTSYTRTTQSSGHLSGHSLHQVDNPNQSSTSSRGFLAGRSGIFNKSSTSISTSHKLAKRSTSKFDGNVQDAENIDLPKHAKVNSTGALDEVEALRGVFFKFFHNQTKGIKESKKKTDCVKQEPQNFSANPFFSHEIRTFDDSDEKIESHESPRAFTFSTEK